MEAQTAAADAAEAGAEAAEMAAGAARAGAAHAAAALARDVARAAALEADIAQADAHAADDGGGSAAYAAPQTGVRGGLGAVRARAVHIGALVASEERAMAAVAAAVDGRAMAARAELEELALRVATVGFCV